MILLLFLIIIIAYSTNRATKIKANEEIMTSSTHDSKAKESSQKSSLETEAKESSQESSVETEETRVEIDPSENSKETNKSEDNFDPFSFYVNSDAQLKAFGATAIPQVMKVGDTFSKKPEELVKNVVLPEGHTASFSYAEGKLPFIDNTTENSVMLKVYMIDNDQPENKVLIKVPLAIIAKDSKNKYAGVQENTQISIDYADYRAKVTTKEDQLNYLLEKAGIMMWEIATGNPVKIGYYIGSGTGTLPSGNPAMFYFYEEYYKPLNVNDDKVLALRFSFRDKENTIEKNLLNELMSGWDRLPRNSGLGVIRNNLNSSFIGMPFRGLPGTNTDNNENVYIVGDKFRSSAFGALYATNNYYSYIGNKKYDSLTDRSTQNKKLSYYLKKDGMLRQVFVDQKANLVYVIDAYLLKNGYFSEDFSLYNTGSTNVTIGARAAQQVNYDGYGGWTSIFSLGAGFTQSNYYSEAGSSRNIRSFSFKFKDNRGNFLGDQDKWVFGTTERASAQPNKKPPILLIPNYSDNAFGNDFSQSGMENAFYPNKTIVSSIADDTRFKAYQMAATPRSLAPGEKLSTKIHYFAGEELPYIEIETTPKEYNVYEDYDQDAAFEYLLSNIPAEGDNGTITFTFPDDTTKQVNYIGDKNKTSKGSFVVPRATLPEILNSDPGTIKSYETDIFAEDERLGIPSDEYAAPINVYNLGGKPIPQLIQKDKAFTKKPEDLIKDPVILPGNTAVYEYVGELPDTSKVGLTSVLVRMTDKQRPEKNALINVPVEVISGIPPTSGLYLAANDYTGTVQELQGITEAQVAELILKKSEAIAWDVSTGSTKGITLSVLSTTLKPNSPIGTYKATVQAVQGTLSKTKDITITIADKQTVKVEFLDEAGESMHEPVSLLRTVGAKIDLTKEEKVQSAIKEIQNKRYQIYQRPENETALVVQNQETTVAYRFEGTLFISSYPTFMNFGVKALQTNTPFIRVEKARYNKPLTIWDNRKGTKPWVLTATLEKALTSYEDTSKILPDAIRYKKDKSTTVVLKQGSTEPLMTKKNQEPGDVNISESWDSGDAGLQLEVPSGKVLQSGKYYATILWQVADTP